MSLTFSVRSKFCNCVSARSRSTVQSSFLHIYAVTNTRVTIYGECRRRAFTSRFCYGRHQWYRSGVSRISTHCPNNTSTLGYDDNADVPCMGSKTTDQHRPPDVRRLHRLDATELGGGNLQAKRITRISGDVRLADIQASIDLWDKSTTASSSQSS